MEQIKMVGLDSGPNYRVQFGSTQTLYQNENKFINFLARVW